MTYWSVCISTLNHRSRPAATHVLCIWAQLLLPCITSLDRDRKYCTIVEVSLNVYISQSPTSRAKQSVIAQATEPTMGIHFFCA